MDNLTKKKHNKPRSSRPNKLMSNYKNKKNQFLKGIKKNTELKSD